MTCLTGDVLAVTKIDLAARNVADPSRHPQAVEEVGASFVATEQDLSTEGAYGRFTVVLLGAVVELGGTSWRAAEGGT